MLKKLTEKLYSKLIYSSKQSGSFDFEENIYLIEESLTSLEYQTVEAFFAWLKTNNKTFGHNLREVYQDYIKEQDLKKDHLYITDDGNTALYYSQDNKQWATTDLDLYLEDKSGRPVFDDGEIVKGSFTQEDFALERGKFIAAIDAESHIQSNSLKSSDQDILDNEENFNTLSALYADDVIDSDEKLTDEDLDRIQNEIHQHLENTFPEFI